MPLRLQRKCLRHRESTWARRNIREVRATNNRILWRNPGWENIWNYRDDEAKMKSTKKVYFLHHSLALCHSVFILLFLSLFTGRLNVCLATMVLHMPTMSLLAVPPISWFFCFPTHPMPMISSEHTADWSVYLSHLCWRHRCPIKHSNRDKGDL